MTPRWPEERIQLFRDLWDRGMSIDDIAVRLDVTVDTIKAARIRFGFPARWQSSPNAKLAATFGFNPDLAGAVAQPADCGVKRETPRQADAWVGIRFDDDHRAPRAEPVLRGRPNPARSLTGCAALAAAGQ